MKCIPTAIAFLGVFASGLFADEKSVTTLNEALAMPTSFRVESESLESAVRRLTKQVQTRLPKDSSFEFEIKLLGGDLKLEGITRNQRVHKFQQRNQPLRNVLTALVQRANGNKAVKDPSQPDQRVLWVVGPDPDNAERQLILITTRQMAKQRSYKLPDVFIPRSTLRTDR